VKIDDIKWIQKGGLFDENIKLILNNRKTISLWAHEVFDEVKAVIEVLKNTDTLTKKSMVSKVKCVACQAVIRSNQNFCEYCRTPLV